MKPETTDLMIDDLRPEYEFDFSNAERGRYARRLKTEGSNLVLVEADLAETFPDSAAVQRPSITPLIAVPRMVTPRRSPRHSRAGGNPAAEQRDGANQTATRVDSRLRGNDGNGR